MTREERELRKLKAEAKQKVAAEALKGPPKDGRSISGSLHLGASPDEWQFAIGLGWYHISEMPWFCSKYSQCVHSEKYYPAGEMVNCYGLDGRVHRSEIGKDWMMDMMHKRAIRKQEAVPCIGETGATGFIHRDMADDKMYCDKCDFTGNLVATRALRKIKHPLNPAVKRVCSWLPKTNSDKFASCPLCGDVAELEGILRREDFKNVICCNSCYVSNVMKNIIHPYNYEGFPPKLSSNPTNKLIVKNELKDVPDESHRLYGVECEVEIHDDSPMSRYQLAQACTKVLGKDFVVMKNDGSLKAHARESELWGFEIVTAPADFAVHEAKWSKLETMDGFKYLRAWDTITCGMHVHVGKSALSLLQVGRIVVFVNHPGNKKFIEKIAGRNSKAASRFLEDKGFADGMKPDPDKYCAVNIRPVHTIEFRIFRGTIRYKHIMRNLEFVDAVCSYCYPAARSLAAIKDYKQFILFCRANRKKYPRLAAWLEDQKFIPASRPKPGVKPEVVEEAVPTETRCQDKWY